MAKEILSNDERLLLIEKYEADKLNKPPKNIKDATLITNYGTDEQKSRLQAAQAAAQQATENKTASPAAGAIAGTGEAPAPATTEAGATEQAAPAVEESGDTGVEQGTTTTTEGAQAAPVQEQAAPAPAVAPDNQAYINAFNDYVDLHKVLPKDSLTAAELETLNAQKRAADKQASDEAAQIKEQMKRTPVQADTVTIIDNVTKESTVISRLTWERFVSKDGTHSLKTEKPAELQ